MTLVSPGVMAWKITLPPDVEYVGSEPEFSVGIEETPVDGQPASLVYAYISNGTPVWKSPATQMYPRNGVALQGRVILTLGKDFVCKSPTNHCSGPFSAQIQWASGHSYHGGWQLWTMSGEMTVDSAAITGARFEPPVIQATPDADGKVNVKSDLIPAWYKPNGSSGGYGVYTLSLTSSGDVGVSSTTDILPEGVTYIKPGEKLTLQNVVFSTDTSYPVQFSLDKKDYGHGPQEIRITATIESV